MRKILDLFPTPLHVSSEIIAESTELEYLNSCELRVDANPTNQKNYGDMSLNLDILNHENLTKISSKILEESTIFAREIMAYDIEGLQFTTSWVSIKNPGQAHIEHSHPNSVISGVYYFDDGTDIDYAKIVFQKHDYRGGKNEISVELDDFRSSQSPYSWSYFTYHPQKNDLIIFPSHLVHKVEPNLSEYPRKCVAFNLIPTIKLGSDTRLTNIIFKTLR